MRGARIQPVRRPPQCDFDELPTVIARGSCAAKGSGIGPPSRSTSAMVSSTTGTVRDVPQGAGQHGPVLVAHERAGRVVEVGDQQRRRGRSLPQIGGVPADFFMFSILLVGGRCQRH